MFQAYLLELKASIQGGKGVDLARLLRVDDQQNMQAVFELLRSNPGARVEDQVKDAQTSALLSSSLTFFHHHHHHHHRRLSLSLSFSLCL